VYIFLSLVVYRCKVFDVPCIKCYCPELVLLVGSRNFQRLGVSRKSSVIEVVTLKGMGGSLLLLFLSFIPKHLTNCHTYEQEHIVIEWFVWFCSTKALDFVYALTKKTQDNIREFIYYIYIKLLEFLNQIKDLHIPYSIQKACIRTKSTTES
jgi:hypothetical protein